MAFFPQSGRRRAPGEQLKMWRSSSMASTRFLRKKGLDRSFTEKGGIVIGVCATEVKSLSEQNLREGNLYQTSVDFLLSWLRLLEVQPQYCGQVIEDSFSRITRMLEARYDFHKWKMSWRTKIEQLSNSGKPIRKRRVGICCQIHPSASS